MIPFKQYLKNVLNEDYTVSWMKDGNPASKQELKVSDVQFSRAYRYLNVNSKSESEAYHVITKEIGLHEKFAKEIVSIVLQYDNSDAFFKAVNNRTEITELLQSGNLINAVVEKYGVDRELAIALLNYTPATQPVTGKGEMFLTLFAKDAKKGGVGGGDVVVGDTHYEIKGQGARLRGQKGFGTTNAALIAFKNGLTALAHKANVPLPSVLEFSIGVKKAGSINAMAPALIASGKVARDDIINLYIDGFSKLYDNAEHGFMYEWLNRSIDEQGKTTAEFNLNYFIFAIQYYTMQEHFDYIVAFVPTGAKAGNVSYISAEQISNNDNITSHILPEKMPGITPGAGPQGGFFSIKPVNA